MALSFEVGLGTTTAPVPRWRTLLWRWFGVWQPKIEVIHTVNYRLFNDGEALAFLSYHKDKDPGVAAVIEHWRKGYG